LPVDFELVTGWERLGLKPVAFAYPGSHGDLPRTRAAVRDAGFLSARMFRAAARGDPYIVLLRNDGLCRPDTRPARAVSDVPLVESRGHAAAALQRVRRDPSLSRVS